MYYSFGIYLKKNMSELSQLRGLSKLEHIILLYDVTLLPQYNYLVNLFSQFEDAETVRAASDRGDRYLNHMAYTICQTNNENIFESQSPVFTRKHRVVASSFGYW